MVSGVVMKAAPEFFQTTPEGFDLREVDVRLARADEVCRWNRVVDRHHYLGFKQFAGRGLRYVFTWRGHWIGAAGWQTGAFMCAPRDRWIGWRRDEQFARLHLIGNNTRFVILGGRRVFLGLASFALSRMVRRLSDDWEAAYGNPLLVAESFVAPTRFSGTMYKAANWTRVGASKGYARASGRYTDRHGEVKDLYVFPLRRDACRRLRDRALLPSAWELKAPQSGRSAQELRSIYQHFAELSDYRRAQGRKHSIASVLCVILLARLANRHGPVAAARYAKRMTQKELEQIGAWKNKATGRYEPVSKSTAHRVLQNTDPSWIEDALQRWAQPRLQVGRAIAIDGKRIRGANRTGEDHYETISLIEHGTGMPVSMLNYHDEGGEIAAVHAALETAPVAGCLLTLDALHTSRETARLIVETHNADWMMTVKGNASETFETFESIDWETTSTGSYCEKPALEHGRIEQRSIEVFTPLAKMINYPHVKQIFRVTRDVEIKKTGKRTTEHAYGMTSVEEASPRQLLEWNRGHWVVESHHYIRDATFLEDNSMLRSGNAPANNAIINMIAIAVIIQNKRKLPKPFNSFADMRHHYADSRKQALRALARPG